MNTFLFLLLCFIQNNKILLFAFYIAAVHFSASRTFLLLYISLCPFDRELLICNLSCCLSYLLEKISCPDTIVWTIKYQCLALARERLSIKHFIRIVVFFNCFVLVPQIILLRLLITNASNCDWRVPALRTIPRRLTGDACQKVSRVTGTY